MSRENKGKKAQVRGMKVQGPYRGCALISEFRIGAIADREIVLISMRAHARDGQSVRG